MTTLTELLGEKLLEHTNKDGGVQENNFMSTSKLNGKVIGLYFSGHWCPPSREFTPRLVEGYKNIYNEVKHKFEIVFISWDRDQQSFDHYFHEMPWKALPFTDRTRQTTLVNRFQVQGIPCLIILSPTGEVISWNGVGEINTDAIGYIRKWSQASSLTEVVPITFADADIQTDPEIIPKKTVVINSDDEEIPLTPRDKKFSKISRIQFYLLIVGIIFIVLLLLLLLTTFIVYKVTPRLRKGTVKMGTKQNIGDIKLKVMFSTDYIWKGQNQSEIIENFEHLTDELNMKLSENKIRVLKAYFIHTKLSKNYRRLICKNSLFGNVLEMYLIVSFVGQCDYEDYMCKFILQEQLRKNFNQLLNHTITIYFDDDRFVNINIKFCSLTEILDDKTIEFESEEETSTLAMPKGLVAGVSLPVPTSNTQCSINPAKIISVLIIGQENTEIRDEISNKNPSTSVTLYENSVNVLRIQLDCGQEKKTNDATISCNHIYQVDVWIDLNDDGIFDELENRIHHRSLIHSEISKRIFQLEISIPSIDGIYIKVGSHRMRLHLLPKQEFRTICNKTNYTQTREYNVNIIYKHLFNVGSTVESVVINRFVCSSDIGKMKWILIGGELNTQILDSIQTANRINQYEKKNQHDIILFGDTIYLLRLQFDCSQPSENDCTLAHYGDVFIDFNHDGRFDPSENRVSRRLHIDGETPINTYDLQIVIPSIDDMNIKVGLYTMRVTLTRSEAYQKQCGHQQYTQTREYIVNIIQRKTCSSEREYSFQSQAEEEEEEQPDFIVQLSADLSHPTYCSPGNLVCSVGHSAIYSIKFSGEENTMINDQLKQCNSINNYQDQSQFIVKLFDTTSYLLRMQFYCVQQDSSFFPNNCHTISYLTLWIDLNNDGIFDQTREQFINNYQINDISNRHDYDFNIYISPTDHQGSRRMRILFTNDQNNLKPCDNNGYGEVRDYTINIIPRY